MLRRRRRRRQRATRTCRWQGNSCNVQCSSIEGVLFFPDGYIRSKMSSTTMWLYFERFLNRRHGQYLPRKADTLTASCRGSVRPTSSRQLCRPLLCWSNTPQDVAFVLITEGKVKGTAPAQYWKRGEGNEFWHEFANLRQAYRSRMGRRI